MIVSSFQWNPGRIVACGESVAYASYACRAIYRIGESRKCSHRVGSLLKFSGDAEGRVGTLTFSD